MELAKDGRWLGGKTPTGFSSQRVTTGSGKNKSAISFLVPVQEEKEIVLEIYSTFWETRSLLQTANIISEKYETKHGAKFTTSTIRLILRNPIYCVADEYSYNYFLEHDGNLFGEPSDFDGQHGLTAYNKTDQMKVEDEDSTFFNPKFSQLLSEGNPGKPRNPHETGGSGSWSQPIYNTFTTFAKTGRALICHPTGSKTPYRDSTPHTAFFH